MVISEESKASMTFFFLNNIFHILLLSFLFVYPTFSSPYSLSSAFLPIFYFIFVPHPFFPPFLFSSIPHVLLCSSPLQACLTVWWIILRFMGDIAEPKLINQEPSIQNNLGQRQDRRLSNLVGLDQVLYIRTKPQIQFNFVQYDFIRP